MKTIKHDVSVRDRVTKKARVVTTIDITHYESLDELLKEHTEGDIVTNFNRQHVQDEANRARVAFTQGPSAKAKRAEGLKWLVANDIARLTEWVAAGRVVDDLAEAVWAEQNPSDE